MKVNDSCEQSKEHKYMWLSAENGVQTWACVQCGKFKEEQEDSQP